MVKKVGRRAGAGHLDHIESDTSETRLLDADDVYLGQVDSTPSDEEIGSGNTAFYAKGDGSLYKKPYGGAESQVGGGVVTLDPLDAADGNEADGSGTRALAAGRKSEATGTNSVSLGEETSDGAATDVVAIGYRAGLFGASNSATIVGSEATVSGSNGVAIGYFSEAGQKAVGINGAATGLGSVGLNADIDVDNAGRVGVDQLVFGGVQNTVADADLNNRELTVEADEGNSQFTIRYKDSNGTVQTGTINFD